MSEFKLPEIGEGVIEGEIVRWLIQPGENVGANQALLEVMTDKATVEIPSPIAGVMQEHKAAEGDICAVGSVIAIIEEGGAASAAKAAPKASTSNGISKPAAPVAAPPASAGPKVPATPAARALAREHGIDLTQIPMDDRGRITKSDVLVARESGVSAPAAIPAAAKAPPAPIPKPSAPPTPAISRGPVEDRQDETIPFRGMRRRIAQGMVKSFTEAVHYTYVEQINVSKLVKLRSDAKKGAAEQGVSLSYLPFIIKAVCHALKRFPIVNAALDESAGAINLYKRYHIGIASATPQGLMVPVVHDADTLSLLDLAREITRLGEATKNGTAKTEELSGSTFTITSLGTIGGVLATPILNYPEVGILGVHAIRKTPIVDDDDNIVVAHMMNLSVSLDHRVVDGYEGASFLQEVKRYLEDPTLLLLAGI